MNAAKKAGYVLKNKHPKFLGDNLKTWNKDEVSLVTEADLLSEKEIISLIKEKDSKSIILSEEATPIFQYPPSKQFWAVDPLCGTVPFSAGLDSWGVSVAYISKSKKTSVGAIFCPVSNELIHCDENKVYKNEEEFSVSPKFPKIKDTTLCLEIERGENWVKLFESQLSWVKYFSQINSFASAVYPGIQVINGKIPLMVIYKISLEHIASLLAIGQKLGLCATDIDGNDLDIDNFQHKIPEWFVFGWPEPHNELMNIIKKIKKGNNV